jgi:hypothetical protein
VLPEISKANDSFDVPPMLEHLPEESVGQEQPETPVARPALRAEEVCVSDIPTTSTAQPEPLLAAEQTGRKRKSKSSSGSLSSKRSKKGVPGKADALVSKWQTVAKNLEEEEV